SPMALERLMKENGIVRLPVAPWTMRLPWKVPSGRSAGGVKRIVIGVESPGPSGAIVMGDARARKDDSAWVGSTTWRGPVAAPPWLLSVSWTMAWLPRSIPAWRLDGEAASSGTSAMTEKPTGMSRIAPSALAIWIVNVPAGVDVSVAPTLY